MAAIFAAMNNRSTSSQRRYGSGLHSHYHAVIIVKSVLADFRDSDFLCEGFTDCIGPRSPLRNPLDDADERLSSQAGTTR
jgi:hypothetical protein